MRSALRAFHGAAIHATKLVLRGSLTRRLRNSPHMLRRSSHRLLGQLRSCAFDTLRNETRARRLANLSPEGGRVPALAS